MRNERFDDIAVTDNGDFRIEKIFMQLAQLSHEPRLHFEHPLASGRARDAALCVELPPLRIGLQRFKAFSRPFAEINFVKLVGDLQLEAGARRQRSGGFARALERAAVKRVDFQSRQPPR